MPSPGCNWADPMTQRKPSWRGDERGADLPGKTGISLERHELTLH